ncbi:unnamed protein product [Camellia sinensis]
MPKPISASRVISALSLYAERPTQVSSSSRMVLLLQYRGCCCLFTAHCYNHRRPHKPPPPAFVRVTVGADHDALSTRRWSVQPPEIPLTDLALEISVLTLLPTCLGCPRRWFYQSHSLFLQAVTKFCLIHPIYEKTQIPLTLDFSDFKHTLLLMIFDP